MAKFSFHIEEIFVSRKVKKAYLRYRISKNKVKQLRKDLSEIG